MTDTVEHMFDLRDPDEAADGDGADALRGVVPDLLGSPEQRIAWVLGQKPSALTLGVLESVVDAVLPRRWRVLAAKAWERQRASVTAYAAAAKVTATVVAPGSTCTQDSADAELALALRRTDGECAFELSRDRRLATFPVVFALLTEGECSPRHADAFVELTRDLEPDDAVAVDAAVSARAASMTVSGFRRVVRKTVARLDSRGPDERHAARRRQIGIRCWPQRDGLVTIAATMPAVDGVAAMVELNRRADALRRPDDPRSHGERQVEAWLAGLGDISAASAPAYSTCEHRGEATAADANTAGSATTPRAPHPAARRSWLRAEVQVVFDGLSLLGLADNPGELIGYGPIPAEDVRAMLAQPGTVLRRLVTDPIRGVLVDYGTTRYRPDAYLTGLTKARDVTCRYPGCTANAVHCDGEHCDPFPNGSTSAGNVCQLCRTHHRRKTFDGFSYTRPDPSTGETVWTTPLGFTYGQQPASYDDAGADTGDTHWLGALEAEQRWLPGLPDPPPSSTDPPDPPDVGAEPPPF